MLKYKFANYDFAEYMDNLNKEMEAIAAFLKEGETHGTVVEALHAALSSALSGEAKSVEEALVIGENEWYK